MVLSFIRVFVGLHKSKEPSQDKETKEAIHDTFNLSYELNPDSTAWNLMTPYPGNKFFELAESNDWVATKDWSEYTSFESVLKYPNAKELDKARKIVRHKLRLFRFLKKIELYEKNI